MESQEKQVGMQRSQKNGNNELPNADTADRQQRPSAKKRDKYENIRSPGKAMSRSY